LRRDDGELASLPATEDRRAMTDELIAYLLDDLPPERRAEVERRLAAEPAWQAELERLQECLAATGDPCQCVDEPPPDLVMKTCYLVEHAEERRCGDATPAPRPAVRRAAGFSSAVRACGGARRHRLTLADVSFGSGALVLLGCLIAPALLETRDSSRGLVCQDNLRWLGSQLFDYQERMPNHELPPVLPGEHAGMFAVRLAKHGVDRHELTERLVCPNTSMAEDVFAGRLKWMVPTEEEVEHAQGRERLALVKTPWGSYAIRLGRFDEEDLYHLPTFTGSNEPLLADEPDLTQPGWASSNHPGGQHVLNEDMSVAFRTHCLLGGGRDNIFRNAAGAHAAAFSDGDRVLSRPDYGPTGPMFAPFQLLGQ
jgi:hypothetical protein